MVWVTVAQLCFCGSPETARMTGRGPGSDPCLCLLGGQRPGSGPWARFADPGIEDRIEADWALLHASESGWKVSLRAQF